MRKKLRINRIYTQADQQYKNGQDHEFSQQIDALALKNLIKKIEEMPLISSTLSSRQLNSLLYRLSFSNSIVHLIRELVKQIIEAKDVQKIKQKQANNVLIKQIIELKGKIQQYQKNIDKLIKGYQEAKIIYRQTYQQKDNQIQKKANEIQMLKQKVQHLLYSNNVQPSKLLSKNQRFRTCYDFTPDQFTFSKPEDIGIKKSEDIQLQQLLQQLQLSKISITQQQQQKKVNQQNYQNLRTRWKIRNKG